MCHACCSLLLYSDHSCYGRYNDNDFEYRHVQLPKQMLKAIPKDYFDGARGTLKLLWEDEWRGLGITQVQPHRNHLLKQEQVAYTTQHMTNGSNSAESRMGALRSA